MTANVDVVFNPTTHDRVLEKTLPAAITTEAEYEAMLAAIEILMRKGLVEGEESLTEDENALLDSMAELVEAYEDKYYPLE